MPARRCHRPACGNTSEVPEEKHAPHESFIMKRAGSRIVQQQVPMTNNCLKWENNLFLMTNVEKAFIGTARMECTLRKAAQRCGVDTVTAALRDVALPSASEERVRGNGRRRRRPALACGSSVHLQTQWLGSALGLGLPGPAYATQRDCFYVTFPLVTAVENLSIPIGREKPGSAGLSGLPRTTRGRRGRSGMDTQARCPALTWTSVGNGA